MQSHVRPFYCYYKKVKSKVTVVLASCHACCVVWNEPNLMNRFHFMSVMRHPAMSILLNFGYSSKPKEEWPNTTAKALRNLYPNVYVLLKICCTIPVTSCKCERGASALRWLHIYNRTSTAQGRLSLLMQSGRFVCPEAFKEAWAWHTTQRLSPKSISTKYWRF